MRKGMTKAIAGVLLGALLCTTVLTALPAGSLTAEAAETYTYVDENGTLQTTGTDVGTVVDSSNTTHWNKAWMVVPADTSVTITGAANDQGVVLDCDVNLILCDGATLTITADAAGIDGEAKYRLTIYGQSGQTGKLNVTSAYQSTLDVEDLSIYGGDITATGNTDGVKAIDTLMVGGGILHATGTVTYGLDADTITLKGGQVYAKGGAYAIAYDTIDNFTVDASLSLMVGDPTSNLQRISVEDYDNDYDSVPYTQATVLPRITSGWTHLAVDTIDILLTKDDMTLAQAVASLPSDYEPQGSDEVIYARDGANYAVMRYNAADSQWRKHTEKTRNELVNAMAAFPDSREYVLGTITQSGNRYTYDAGNKTVTVTMQVPQQITIGSAAPGFSFAAGDTTQIRMVAATYCVECDATDPGATPYNCIYIRSIENIAGYTFQKGQKLYYMLQCLPVSSAVTVDQITVNGKTYQPELYTGCYICAVDLGTTDTTGKLAGGDFYVRICTHFTQLKASTTSITLDAANLTLTDAIYNLPDTYTPQNHDMLLYTQNAQGYLVAWYDSNTATWGNEILLQNIAQVDDYVLNGHPIYVLGTAEDSGNEYTYDATKKTVTITLHLPTQVTIGDAIPTVTWCAGDMDDIEEVDVYYATEITGTGDATYHNKNYQVVWDKNQKFESGKNYYYVLDIETDDDVEVTDVIVNGKSYKPEQDGDDDYIVVINLGTTDTTGKLIDGDFYVKPQNPDTPDTPDTPTPQDTTKNDDLTNYYAYLAYLNTLGGQAKTADTTATVTSPKTGESFWGWIEMAIDGILEALIA